MAFKRALATLLISISTPYLAAQEYDVEYLKHEGVYCSKSGGDSEELKVNEQHGFGLTHEACRQLCLEDAACKLYSYNRWLQPGRFFGRMRCQLFSACSEKPWDGLELFVKANRCMCDNGTAATGAFCTTDGASLCAACDTGFTLTGSTCRENKCTCVGGTAAAGVSCPTDGAPLCTSCYFGLLLQDDACNISKVSLLAALLLVLVTVACCFLYILQTSSTAVKCNENKELSSGKACAGANSDPLEPVDSLLVDTPEKKASVSVCSDNGSDPVDSIHSLLVDTPQKKALGSACAGAHSAPADPADSLSVDTPEKKALGSADAGAHSIPVALVDSLSVDSPEKKQQ